MLCVQDYQCPTVTSRGQSPSRSGSLSPHRRRADEMPSLQAADFLDDQEALLEAGTAIAMQAFPMVAPPDTPLSHARAHPPEGPQPQSNSGAEAVGTVRSPVAVLHHQPAQASWLRRNHTWSLLWHVPPLGRDSCMTIFASQHASLTAVHVAPGSSGCAQPRPGRPGLLPPKLKRFPFRSLAHRASHTPTLPQSPSTLTSHDCFAASQRHLGRPWRTSTARAGSAV